MPCLNIWLMALLPPPPTPITLMTFDWFLGRSNEMLSNSVMLLISIYFIPVIYFYSYCLLLILFGIIQELLEFFGPFIKKPFSLFWFITFFHFFLGLFNFVYIWRYFFLLFLFRFIWRQFCH